MQQLYYIVWNVSKELVENMTIVILGNDMWHWNFRTEIIRIMVTVQQACAFAVVTVRK